MQIQSNIQIQSQISNLTSITQAISSIPRASVSFYNALPLPIRALFYIPVKGAQIIQRNVFPTILFTEGYHLFRQHLGFSSEKLVQNLVIAGFIYLTSPTWIMGNIFLGALISLSNKSFEIRLNNLFLYGMLLCAIAKFYVNPWFMEKYQEIDAIWYNIDNKTITDEEYYASYYLSIWNFSQALSVSVSFELFNNILSSLLSKVITFKKQYEFVQEWLSNYSAYGINAGNTSSGSEIDNERANLNPVKLFEDIQNQSAIFFLWNSRVNSIINCYTAVYALLNMSPPLALSFYFGTIILPRLLVACVAYSLFYNALLALFEIPSKYLFQTINKLKDSIIRQITNIDTNAELITLHEGEKFEETKLLNLHNETRKQSIKYTFVDSGKNSISSFIMEFQWLLPFLATLDSVRTGVIKQEEVGPCLHHYFRINHFMTWVKDNFDQLNAIEQSTRRLALYTERLQAWRTKRVEIEKKVTVSDEISFDGSIFADEEHKTLLAKGKFTLEPSSIIHIDAPSGCGKTTLFRIFRRVWGEFDGTCTLPKETAFLPSQVYVLGIDEPLFQWVCYPNNHKDLASNLELVKGWLGPKNLNLPEHVFNNLVNLPVNGDEKSKTNTVFNWMTTLSDGERKRIAFCNILLKLHTQNIKFLIMDEPFKGVDYQTQKIMTNLFKDAISHSKSKCTVLFSNHEHNHQLNTHTLSINKVDKEYKLMCCAQ